MRIMDILYVPMGWVMEQLNLIFDSYGLAIVAFTILINIIQIPIIIYQQKSTAKQHRLKPKLDALKTRHGDDKMAYNKAMQQLYAEEKANPLLGCLPLLLTFPILFGVIAVIYGPLTYSTDLTEAHINSASQIAIDNNWVSNQTSNTTVKNVREIYYINHWADIEPQLEVLYPDDIETLRSVDELLNFDFGPFDLTEKPDFSINVVQDFNINWLIPIVALLAQFVVSYISTKVTKRNNPGAPTMAALMYIMPLFSFFISFKFPIAIGFYWIISSVVSGGIRIWLQIKYSPKAVSAASEMDAVMQRRAKENIIINQHNA